MNKKITLAIMFVIIIISGVFYLKQYKSLCPTQTIEMGTYDSVDRGVCFGKYGIKNTTERSIQIKRYKVRSGNEKYLDTTILKPGDVLTIEKHKGISYRYVNQDSKSETIEIEITKID